jgi:hypothetical protein
VVVGFEPHPDYLNQLYRTASTTRIAYVIDNPYAIFEIQSDGTFVVGDVGTTASFAVGAGNTSTGLSGMYLNHADMGNDKNLRILSVSNVVGSEIGLYTKAQVLINLHIYKSTTVGV